MSGSSLRRRAGQVVRRSLLSGLKVLLPLMVLILAFNLVQTITSKFLGDYAAQLAQKVIPADWSVGPLSLENVPFLSLLLMLLIFFCVGLFGSTAIGTGLIERFDAIVARIPFVGGLYGTVRRVTRVAAAQSGKQGFDRVVYIDATGHGQLQLALVIKEIDLTVRATPEAEPTTTRHLVVMIPSPPNPSGGPIRLVPVSQAFDADMSLTTAIQVLMTFGLDTPEALALTGIER